MSSTVGHRPGWSRGDLPRRVAGGAILALGGNGLSFLMTTAYQTDNTGAPIQREGGTAASPLDYGAGHVRPAWVKGVGARPGPLPGCGYRVTGDGWDGTTWRTAEWDQVAWDARMWRWWVRWVGSTL